MALYITISLLALCCINSVYHQFFRYITRQALTVYRLIHAALIGSFSMFLFFILKSKFLTNVVPGQRIAAKCLKKLIILSLSCTEHYLNLNFKIKFYVTVC